jgi:hypothetical protein
MLHEAPSLGGPIIRDRQSAILAFRRGFKISIQEERGFMVPTGGGGLRTKSA